MAPRSRESFLRRLGRALRGVNAVEYGRPVPSDQEPSMQPAPALVVNDPYRPPAHQGRGADAAADDEAPPQR